MEDEGAVQPHSAWLSKHAQSASCDLSWPCQGKIKADLIWPREQQAQGCCCIRRKESKIVRLYCYLYHVRPKEWMLCENEGIDMFTQYSGKICKNSFGFWCIHTMQSCIVDCQCDVYRMWSVIFWGSRVNLLTVGGGLPLLFKSSVLHLKENMLTWIN